MKVIDKFKNEIEYIAIELIIQNEKELYNLLKKL